MTTELQLNSPSSAEPTATAGILPTATAGILDSVRDLITRYVRLPRAEYLDTLALWVLHTHAIGAAYTSPRLLLRSAEKESGKTRTLEVLRLLVPARSIFNNPSAATLYRLLKERPETFLIDEVDNIFTGKQDSENKDLQSLLNQGYRRGATVPRCVGEGSKQHVELFPVFGAVAMASLRDLPDTTQSRSLVIHLVKRTPDERVARFHTRHAEADTQGLRQNLQWWAEKYQEELQERDPVMPAGVTDRAAELWEPLLAIADLAGGEWPDRARRAAVAATEAAEDLSETVQLLDCIRVVFGDRDKLPSATLCSELNAREEWPWGGWHKGLGITARDLARLLKPHRIKPKNVRTMDGGVPKGYEQAQFLDA